MTGHYTADWMTLRPTYRTYRRDIKVHIGPWKSKTRVERALILLLESGFVYCIIWVSIIPSRMFLLRIVLSRMALAHSIHLVLYNL